jgi:hypothetical protein
MPEPQIVNTLQTKSPTLPAVSTPLILLHMDDLDSEKLAEN